MKTITKRIIVIVLMLCISPYLLLITYATSNNNSPKSATISVDSIVAYPGATIKVALNIKDNPGISGALITISYDHNLRLIAAESGSAFKNLFLTLPEKYNSPCSFLWDSQNDETNANGSIITLTFEVSKNAKIGDNLKIVPSCKLGDIYNSNTKTVDIELSDGSINLIKDERNFLQKAIGSIKNNVKKAWLHIKNKFAKIFGGKSL